MDENTVTVPYTPEQNGVSERYYRSILEKSRCMLADCNAPKQMWSNAVNTAVYLINRSPTKKLEGALPDEKWTDQKVDVSHLRIFGSRVYVHLPKAKRKKLDFKSEECILVGYSETSKGYRVFDPKTHTVRVARNVHFIENSFTSSFTDMKISNKTEKASLNFKKATFNGDDDQDESSNEQESIDELENKSSTSDVSLDHPGEIEVDNNVISEVNDSQCQVESDVKEGYPKRNSCKPVYLKDYVTDSSFGESDCMLTVLDSLEPSTLSGALSRSDRAK